ncbi:MAG: Asp-tRNA(Asn)/Glu-tRNA(Gln) amidotransferase subunit GatA [Proteobacteria bacterium]|nr:Asp-tRNA(Asn)/Glu-tRNA(Gln) amidotransferase subunit GatA [Pseudomonadota bacterium]
MTLYNLSIHDAAERLRKKEISSRELTLSVLERIAKTDTKVKAYITLNEDQALAQADQADQAISKGIARPLTGIPLSIKDLICTQGLLTTCASKILENFVPTYDATVIEKLKAQGAVILGKVNMDEFAMGSTTEHSGFKITANPWNLDHTPGGSSGGSAASVAADMCLGSLGSDTGGSIRQPASHCSVVGLKPTYGRVSRYGLVAFASSLDQIGPLTKNVKDCALMMNAIAGYDPKDSTSVNECVPDFTATLTQSIKGKKIGIPREYFSTEGIDPDVKNSIDQALDTLKSLGAQCVDISLPHTPYAVAAYYVIAPSEASSNLARFDGVKYGIRDMEQTELVDMYKKSRSRGFGLEVQRRIIIGTYALSSGYYDAYYKKASQVRTLIIRDFKAAFESCDILISPVSPSPASIIGQHSEDPLKMYLSDIFTISANMAGIPGLSVPCGFNQMGLPVGLHLMGRHFDEATLLNVAHCFESATDFHTKRPSL